jgi:hypothetical protein
MRAVVIREHGGPEVLAITEVPTPEPGFGQVRVRVRACALNHLDLWIRRGLPGAPWKLPRITGADVAGDIDALGPGVSGLAIGEPVMVMPGPVLRPVRALRQRRRSPVLQLRDPRRARRRRPRRVLRRAQPEHRPKAGAPGLHRGCGPLADLPHRLAHAGRPRGAPRRGDRARPSGRQRRRQRGDPDRPPPRRDGHRHRRQRPTSSTARASSGPTSASTTAPRTSSPGPER